MAKILTSPILFCLCHPGTSSCTTTRCPSGSRSASPTGFVHCHRNRAQRASFHVPSTKHERFLTAPFWCTRGLGRRWSSRRTDVPPTTRAESSHNQSINGDKGASNCTYRYSQNSRIVSINKYILLLLCFLSILSYTFTRPIGKLSNFPGNRSKVRLNDY